MGSLHSQLKSGAHRHFGQGARLLKRIVINAISGGWHVDLGPFRIGSWLLHKTWRNLTFTSTFTFCQIDIYILVNRHLHPHLQSTPDGSKPTFTWVILIPGDDAEADIHPEGLLRRLPPRQGAVRSYTVARVRAAHAGVILQGLDAGAVRGDHDAEVHSLHQRGAGRHLLY